MNHALMLVGWDVTGVKVVGNVQQATASYQGLLDTCPKCGAVGRLYRHGTKTVEYRDAPAFGKQFVIQCKVQRFRCRECNETCMQPLPDMDERRHMTKRCVEYIGQQGIRRTFADIARDVGIDEKTVRNVCQGHFKRLLSQRRIEAPLILGIDEVNLLHRRRTVFVDIGGRRFLDMIDGMDRQRTERWLYKLPNRERVKIVAIDMCSIYRNAVALLLPGVKIVVDKWHVQDLVLKALDRTRARAIRAANRGKLKNPHYGVRLLKTSRHNLSARRQFMLDGILVNSPILDAAWHAKEAFWDIWEITSRAEAEKRYDAWAKSIPAIIEPEFGAVMKTIGNWRKEVFAYFDYPATNAYTEARNRFIKDLNRDGRGYSFERIRAKVLLAEAFTVKTCPFCKGEYPASSFRPAVVRLPGRDDIVLEGMEDWCSNCHFTMHQMEWEVHDEETDPYIPGPNSTLVGKFIEKRITR